MGSAKNQDALTPINTQPLIPAEKIIDKSLDQMTLPERADLLREAYALVEGEKEITDEEMEVIGRLETALESKISAWGLVVQKTQTAVDLCKIESDYYKQKAAAAKERADKFQAKADRMEEYLKTKMIEFNLKKIETPSITVSLRKKPAKVEFIGDVDINSPEHRDFVRTTVSQAWDKKAIKAKLDEGQLFKTVKLSDPDFSISIKGA